jgi:hypothetical protein
MGAWRNHYGVPRAVQMCTHCATRAHSQVVQRVDIQCRPLSGGCQRAGASALHEKCAVARIASTAAREEAVKQGGAVALPPAKRRGRPPTQGSSDGERTWPSAYVASCAHGLYGRLVDADSEHSNTLSLSDAQFNNNRSSTMIMRHEDINAIRAFGFVHLAR